MGLAVDPGMALEIGINGKKLHNFDLGDAQKKVVIECKAHTWTEGGNVPSAKMTTWNQAMFFFHASPSGYRKILLVLRDFSQKKRDPRRILHSNELSPHPKDVEVWEYDEKLETAKKIK